MSENLNTSNVENDNSVSAPTTAEADNNTIILKHEKHLIEMRRARVLELWSQGWSQPKIAAEMHVVQSTIHEDIAFLKQQAREQIKEFVTSELPNTVARAKVTLDMITQKLWATVAQAERDRDEKIKMQALAAIQSAEMQKIEIVSNTGIVDSVITAAEQRQQEHSSIQNGHLAKLKEEEETEVDESTSDNNKAIPIDDSGDRE